MGSGSGARDFQPAAGWAEAVTKIIRKIAANRPVDAGRSRGIMELRKVTAQGRALSVTFPSRRSSDIRQLLLAQRARRGHLGTADLAHRLVHDVLNVALHRRTGRARITPNDRLINFFVTGEHPLAIGV